MLFKAVQYRRKGNAIADDNQLTEIVKIAKREFMRRGVSQHTLEKICNRKPVRVAKLAKCLKLIEELKEGAAPYKDPERKKEWERLHRRERLTRRRELRHGQALEQTTRPGVARESSGGVGFLVPLVAGGALAAWNPMLGMGAGSLTLVVAAVWKKNWAWWLVGCVTLFIALLFYFTNNEKTDSPTGSSAQA
jgi:hypothetical protein